MATSSPRLMPMDLYRDADGYVLNADLPGIDPQSV
ncbi:MAG: Hsp20/alpha crystallin family protein, partial [Leifsonia sp.]